MVERVPFGAAFLAAGALAIPPAGAEYPVAAEHVAFVNMPTFATHAPGDFERVFVLEKAGRIRVIRSGALLPTPFLDISALVASSGLEQGLLGLAFHPDYQDNGHFYVYYASGPAGDRVVARYGVTSEPDIADTESALAVMSVAGTYGSHYGGWLGFGPLDGLLYVSVGDGAPGVDSPDNAQNLEVLLGKMLRIDVDCDAFPEDETRNYGIPPDNPFAALPGADEIWAFGLRNPWRCSFDRATGDLYIGDVGLAYWEELDFRPAASTGGENFGWDCKEGTHCTARQTCDCTDPNLVDPIFDFPNEGLSAVIGGYVYRGCAIPELEGAVIFGDWEAGARPAPAPRRGIGHRAGGDPGSAGSRGWSADRQDQRLRRGRVRRALHLRHGPGAGAQDRPDGGCGARLQRQRRARRMRPCRRNERRRRRRRDPRRLRSPVPGGFRRRRRGQRHGHAESAVGVGDRPRRAARPRRQRHS